MTPRSLSFRLLAGAVLWIVAALVVAGFVLSALFRAHVERQFALQMEAHLDELAATVDVRAAPPDDRISIARPLSDPLFRRPYSGLYWQIGSPDGRLLRSRSLWDTILPLPEDVLADGQIHRHRLPGPAGQDLVAFERAVFLSGSEGFVRLAVASDARQQAELAGTFTRALIRWLVILAAGLIMAATAQVFGGLMPLRRLRAAIIKVRDGSTARLEGRYPDEIQPLADDLNQVLEENAEVVGRARIQAGDLAHSLKTSLAVLRNEAAALAAKGESEAATRLTEQLSVMQRRIDFHMARARVAAARHVPGIATPVASCLEALARTMRQIVHDRSLQIGVESAPDHVFRGERQDLEEMVGNLLDNACKWTQSRVLLRSERLAPGTLSISVDDDGPGIPAENGAQALARGIRLDEQSAGAGLGLAIVRDLADSYGGSVDLDRSPLGGLSARLVLPAVPVDPSSVPPPLEKGSDPA